MAFDLNTVASIDEATSIMNALSSKFNLPLAVFTPEDLRTALTEEFTDDDGNVSRSPLQIEQEIDEVLDSRLWTRTMQEQMIASGWFALYTNLSDED